ncbi:MAG: hypothetical protein ACE5KT_06420, partial [Methanosarcinales archaeon]
SNGESRIINLNGIDYNILFTGGYESCCCCVDPVSYLGIMIKVEAHDTTPPIITSATASPDTIIANGIDTSLLNVTAIDDISGIASVTVNLSAIGGSANQEMQNNNGVWQHITNATVIGSFKLQVIVTDNAGNSNTSFIELNTIVPCNVTGDFNDNCRVDIGDVTYVAYMVVGKIPVDMDADFNGNGRVDIGDATKIAYYVVGKISEL